MDSRSYKAQKEGDWIELYEKVIDRKTELSVKVDDVLQMFGYSDKEGKIQKVKITLKILKKEV